MNKVLFAVSTASLRFKVRTELEREITCLFARTVAEAKELFQQNLDDIAMVVVEDTLLGAMEFVLWIRGEMRWSGVHTLLVICSEEGHDLQLDLIRESHSFGISTEHFIDHVREYVVYQLPLQQRRLS